MENKTTIHPLCDQFARDIEHLWKTPEERRRATELVTTMQEQSRERKIIQIRYPSDLKRFYGKWYIRFKYGIHWRKPLYPLRLARNYGLQFFYRIFNIERYVFRGIEFALTFKCNFRCNHCLCARIDESSTRKELEPHEYKRIVKEAMKLGATTFGMEGGEPFVHPNWEKIVKAWKPRYNHIIVSTNGYLLNEKLIKKLSKIGISTINFSLDSGIPELHDLFRRKRGSYDKVRENTRHCRKHGIKVVYNTVVYSGNLYTDGFIKLLEISEKEKIMLNILYAKGVGAFKDKNVMLTEEDFTNFKKIVEPYNYWSIHHEADLPANHGGVGCPGVKEMVNMTPYGDVINCANNHIYLGNVREEPLAVIRERALKKSPFGKYRPCFLTMDKDFMKVYYPLLEEKRWVNLEEFRQALHDYEQRQNKIVYPDMT